MRVLLFGATGALGSHLVPLLVAKGHSVTGATRSADKLGQIQKQGAESLVLDALDRQAVVAAIRQLRPEVVIHQLTAIPQKMDLRKIDQEFELTNRLRTEGTDHLLEGARAAGVRQVIAQSFGAWTFSRKGGPPRTEEEPLDSGAPAPMSRILDAIRHVETVVPAHPGGLVLRYAAFYGPRTSLCQGGSQVEAVKRRQFPILGRGIGIWSFLHMKDAATATLQALETGARGLYNVADDEPAPVAEWLPYLASVLGSKPPMRLPAFLGRVLIGPHAVTLMNEVRGLSNAKIRRELNWRPQYASWREGFRTGLV